MLYGDGSIRGPVVGRVTKDGGQAVGKPNEPKNLLTTILHAPINVGMARVAPGLPHDVSGLLPNVV